MTDISRSALFGKLNTAAYRAIEGATVFCKLRGNPYVELVHWVHQLLQATDSDLHRIMRRFAVDASQIAADVTAALDQLPRGATSISDLSSHVEHAVERAWVYGTLMFGQSQIRTGHLVVGLLKTRQLRHELIAISSHFERISADVLTSEFAAIVAGSPEDRLQGADGSAAGADPGEAGGAMKSAPRGRQAALRRFAMDLTAKARAGELDAVTGRDEEIRQVVDILMRRRQNNPILTGEAGVGKTAIVEGFALRVVRGDVPPALRDVAVHVLDIGLLQAGASMQGEFENRLGQVIDEVQASPRPIILFVDEAHTLMGAGGAAGTRDAANLLKPALARGTLRTIAATTWAEYRRHIEKDPALTRRFQVVKVEEPGEDRAVAMLRGTLTALERHHRVLVLDEALEAAVRLSHRYIPARQLPDKAVSLLDTACARVAISQHAVPAPIEDCRSRITALDIELEIMVREAAVGLDRSSRRASVEEERRAAGDELAALESRWQIERDVVDRILEIREALRDPNSCNSDECVDQPVTMATALAAPSPRGAGRPAAVLDPPSTELREGLLAELASLQRRLTAIQGDSPLILPTVTGQAVASVVQDWTGIPVGRMVRNEIDAVLHLADTLERRVVGQRHALDLIARRVQTSRAGLDNPGKPVGVFLLCGPSGVGKTETALALAEALYGGDHQVITINMSEFQEAHTVSSLKGAPPGYVGYGEGGVLTEAVRRRPYSVVLLDEIEKAHPDVHELFFQVFDKGWMEDGEGRRIDFRNTIILMTSNVGTEVLLALCRDPEVTPNLAGVTRALRAPLLKTFTAALLGRLTVVPYYPLSDNVLRDIVRLQLDRITQRIAEQHAVVLHCAADVVDHVAERCTEVESGGRMIDALLTDTLLPAISRECLARMMTGTPLVTAQLRVRNGEFAFEFA